MSESKSSVPSILELSLPSATWILKFSYFPPLMVLSTFWKTLQAYIKCSWLQGQPLCSLQFAISQQKNSTGKFVCRPETGAVKVIVSKLCGDLFVSRVWNLGWLDWFGYQSSSENLCNFSKVYFWGCYFQGQNQKYCCIFGQNKYKIRLSVVSELKRWLT